MGWMERRGGRLGSGWVLTGSWGSGLAWGLLGRLPRLGLNLLELVLGPSTMAWRAGGAGRAFSLAGSLKEISFSAAEILVGVLRMLLEFLILSTLDLDLSIVLALTGVGTSSP